MSDNTLVEGIDNVNLNAADAAAAEEPEVICIDRYESILI